MAEETGVPEVQESETEGSETQVEVEENGFKPITSQEQLDAILKPRLDRMREKAAKYDEYVESQKTESQKQADKIAELEKSLNVYKVQEEQAGWKREVSQKTGVPESVLRGSTPEEIQAHAESLSKVFNVGKQPVVGSDGRNVGVNTETSTGDLVRDALARRH